MLSVMNQRCWEEKKSDQKYKTKIGGEKEIKEK